MSLPLDARQRAMLEEMGIRLFLPEGQPAGGVRVAEEAWEPSGAPVVADTPATFTATGDAAAAASRGPTPARPLPAAPAPAPAAVARTTPAGALPNVEGLSWDALAETAAGLAGTGRMVFGAGDVSADWLLVGEPLTEEEELDATPFAGQAGKLLDNMLSALGLNRRQGVYLTNAVKARPPTRGLQPHELAAWEAILRRQVALVQPRVILAMGRFPVQLLLQSTEPLGRLRGQTHSYQGVPVVVTYAPGYLLRTMPDKARAWADLCLARSMVG